jgi:hypothetical protein
VAFSPKLIAEKGEQIYSDRYKAEFEKKYPGRFVAIEINSGEAFLADSAEEAISKVEKKCNYSLFHLIRIGAPGVYRVGYYARRDWLA